MAKPSFLPACAATAALILAALATVNVAIDVSRIYRPDSTGEQLLVRHYVNRMVHSAGGVVQVPWDRAVKLELARVSDAGCFVTGSSRAMIFGGEALRSLGLSCSSVANLAVSGAGYEDFVITAARLLEKPRLGTVLVGIDPWAFRFDSDRRYSAPLYRDARQSLGLPERGGSGGWDRLTNLFNGQYFRRNLDSLLAGRATVEVKEIEAGDGNLADDENLYRPDGSLLYARRLMAEPPPADAFVGKGSVKIQPPFLDSRLTDEFETILAQMEQRGARVVFLLAPYHPKVMRCESLKACTAMTAVEAWARGLASRRNYGVIGGFDPRPFAMTASYFRDDLHMDVSAIRLLATTPEVSR